jgi:hypothetical protein
MSDELIKINPRDLPYLYKFIYQYLTINPSNIPNLSNLTSNPYSLRAGFYPKYLTLSVYKYSTILSSIEDDIRKIVGMESTPLSPISCGSLSLFKAYEVPSGIKPKINLSFRLDDKNVYRMESIELDFGLLDKYTRYGTQVISYFEKNKALERFPTT